ncbi:hypothetical protein H5410_034702 [Solanum commersonii]|uniref:Trichome birefringence-like N-terminal domain-containing protein n=1 Tax=Solanum commersonii TaxID=4109 RepID=A0A9J5YW89_SOLCO|nr:hypothetical protein H5410_034702 [Solanum commersonii]
MHFLLVPICHFRLLLILPLEDFQENPSPGVLGCFFFTVCLFLCLFLLDYSTVNKVPRLHQPSLFATWIGINGSSLPYNKSETVDFLGKGAESCDIFDGNWVWDESFPLYESKDCNFLDEGFRCSENGRPDNFYTKWRWQPKDCNLPRFDAKTMLEKLRNRRVVFVGDSIGRNQWESLLCMLSSAVPDKSKIYEVNGNPITKHMGFLIFKFKDFNCTIEYYRAPFLVFQGRPPSGAPRNVKLTLRLDQMDWSSAQWKGADVLGMATEGDVNATSTTNIRPDGGKKFRKGKKHQKSLEEMLLDPTPSEALTSHPPSTTKASDEERGMEAIDVTAGEEWVSRVEVARQAVEILGRRMNVADGGEVDMTMNIETAYRRSISTLVDWIGHEVNMTKTHVVFRTC